MRSDQPLDHFSHLKKIKKSVGEYVIFKYEGEFFPGKIVSLSKEHVEIMAMQNSLKSWKLLDKADIEKYDWNDFNNIEMDEDGFIPVEAGKFGLKEKEENYYCKKRIGPNVTAFQVDQMFSVHVLTTQKNLNAYSHDKKVIPVCKKLCMHITRIKPKRLINIADKILNGKSLRENRGGDRVSSKSSAKKTSLLKKCPLNKPEKKNRHYQGRGIEQEDKSQIQNNKIKSNGKFRFENKDEQAIKLNKKDWTFKKIVDEPLQQLPLGDPITDGKKDIDSLLKKLYGDNWSDDEKFSFYKKIMLEGREINQEDGKEADIGQCDCLEDDCGLHV
ncbi:hypothetical protein J6590_097038 [Homalodisca vitripennis]|nr:hypothetical protein J6590_097038 [Homalodisca vitripennis]